MFKQCFIGILQACMGTQISWEEKLIDISIRDRRLLFLLVVGNPRMPLPHVHTLYETPCCYNSVHIQTIIYTVLN